MTWISRKPFFKAGNFIEGLGDIDTWRQHCNITETKGELIISDLSRQQPGCYIGYFFRRSYAFHIAWQKLVRGVIYAKQCLLIVIWVSILQVLNVIGWSGQVLVHSLMMVSIKRVWSAPSITFFVSCVLSYTAWIVTDSHVRLAFISISIQWSRFRGNVYGLCVFIIHTGS